MNIRIGDGTVRCRISREELDLLLTGKKIEEALALTGKPVLLTIDPSGEGLEFIYEEGRIGLRASMKSLEELEQMGRKKNGIVSEIGGASFSLQVDLKTYPRQNHG